MSYSNISRRSAHAGELTGVRVGGISKQLAELRKNKRLRSPFKFNGTISRKKITP